MTIRHPFEFSFDSSDLFSRHLQLDSRTSQKSQERGKEERNQTEDQEGHRRPEQRTI